jgi:monoamine oxidase
VLEASSRVGGRAMTRHDPFVGGQYAEAGAEWIDAVHERILALIERFGLQLDSHATTWTAVRRWLHRDGELLGPDDLRRVDPLLGPGLQRFEDRLAEIAAGIVDPADPLSHPDATRYDAQSVAELVEALNLSELTRLFVTRNMQGEFAAEPREVSVLFVAQQRAVYERAAARHGHVEARRLLGGVSALADGLAAVLPPGAVRLDHAVSAIVSSSDSVTVKTASAQFSADVVVLATALAGLRDVAVTKTALQYPSRVWPAGYATTAGFAQRVYEPTADVGGDDPILMAYTGGDGGRELGAVHVSERMRIIEAGEREMYPDLPPALGGFSQSWSAEPRFRGSYAVYRPGEIGRFWDVLRQPHGRIHLAGEHAATWTGYLEGAVESGESVAARLLESR